MLLFAVVLHVQAWGGDDNPWLSSTAAAAAEDRTQRTGSKNRKLKDATMVVLDGSIAATTAALGTIKSHVATPPSTIKTASARNSSTTDSGAQTAGGPAKNKAKQSGQHQDQPAAAAAAETPAPEKSALDLTQEELIARAFAAPDLEAEFKQEKVRSCIVPSMHDSIHLKRNDRPACW